MAGSVHAAFMIRCRPLMAAVSLLAAVAGPAKAQSPQGDPAGAAHVVLYEEDPALPQGRRYEGTVTWRTEPVHDATKLAVRAIVELPQRKLEMILLLRRNLDASRPFSHTVEFRLALPHDFDGGGVENLPGMLMKTGEAARGVPLSGLATKVADNVFLISLSNAETGEPRNIALLAGRAWFDVPLIYRNGRRCILAVEKGPAGERAFTEAFAAWGQSPPAPAPPAVAPRPEPLLDPIPQDPPPGVGYVVQLSSQRSQADAEAAYRALQEKYPSVLASRRPIILRADLGDRGVYFRAALGPFVTSDEAAHVCDDLRNAGGQCVVQRKSN